MASYTKFLHQSSIEAIVGQPASAASLGKSHPMWN